MEFKQYKRKGLSEMRPYEQGEIMEGVSISEADRHNGSPKIGDMVARNPKNHDDKWLVAEKYFNDNLELVEPVKKDGMNFGLALEAAKEGKLIARAGWNGKRMFVFIRPSDELQIDMIVNKVKSLPQAFKNHVDTVMDDNVNRGEKGLGKVKFGSYLCMKAADNSIVNGWLASQTDMLADDWCVVE